MKIAFLESKKATAAICASVLAFLCFNTGLTAEQTLLVISPLAAYIPIEGTIDARRAKNEAPAPQPPAA